MSRFTHILTIAVVLVIAAGVVAAEKPYWVGPMKKVHDGFKGTKGYVAQFGDSITYSMAFWTPIGWDEPDNYLKGDDGYPKRPERRWRDTLSGFRAKGGGEANYSGWRVDQLLRAVDPVLKRQKPEAAIIMIGTNDIAGGKIPDSYRENLEQVIDKCIDAHCIPILSTIPPRRGRDEVVKEINEIIRDVAQQKKIPLCDFYTACLRIRPGDSWNGTIIGGDGVHPSGGKVNVYTEENMKDCGYALRNWVTFLTIRQVYFEVMAK